MPTTKFENLYGSVWNAGDLVASYDLPRWPATDQRGRYSVVLCVKARVVDERGKVRKPARTAVITDTSWAAVCREVMALGFTRPHLTATQVRNGQREHRAA